MSIVTVHVIGFLLMLLRCKCTNETGKIVGDLTFAPTYTRLNCYGEAFENVLFPTLSKLHTKANTMLIDDCLPSKVSYIEALRRIHFVISAITINVHLEFERPLRMQPFNASHFVGLAIKELTISNIVRSEWFYDWSLDILKPIRTLEGLVLMRCNLPSLPETSSIEEITVWYGKSLGPFGGCKKLRHLTLFHWNLEHITDRWLSKCSRLESVSLFTIYNFTNEQMRRLVDGLNFLEKFVSSLTGLSEFPIQLLHHMEKLRDLSMKGNQFRKLQLHDIRLNSLTHLNLESNNILELQGLPKVNGRHFYLYLNNNPIELWQFDEADYELLKNASVHVSMDQLLDCDCRHSWFTRAVRDRRLNLFKSPTRCADGTEFTQVTRSMTDCDRFNCDGCTCRRQWSDNTTVARCAGAATRVPRVWGLRALHAAGNRVETVSADDLPDSLLFLDLARNQLSGMDVNASRMLFSVKGRLVRLAGNPLRCHCENKALIEALKTHKSQVDYNKLWCIFDDKKRAIRDVVVSELCSMTEKIQRDMQLSRSLGVLAALLGLAAGAGVLYWRNRQNIKVYLYARGYCLWWLREEEVDSDRLYDAFLSFSHDDEQFVLDEIIPPLDSEYKLCLHYRDWVVGDFIPAQISRSVQQSRRTIIVLSNNFVKSVWGLLEFRTAHESALREGRARVIVIVLDDVVNDERLAPELRNYVRTNTYVRWGDKWFWEKLRYAMPHHLSSAHTPVTTQPTAANISMGANISRPVSA